MRAALRTIGAALQRYERYAWLYIQANLIAVLLFIPVVTAPAAWAGLIHLAHVQQTETHISLNDFWAGFRQHFARSLLLGVINVVVIGILLVNFFSYAPGQGAGFVILRVAWAIILIVWLCIQFYVWPLLEMMDESLPVPLLIAVGLRNAALMLFRNPGYTVTLIVVAALWGAFCSLLIAPLVMFFLAMLATVAAGAARDRLSAG